MSKFFQLEISSIDEAQLAARNASYAAYFSGILTALIAGISIANEEAMMGGIIDGWALLDAILILILGFFVGRYSRFAAVVLLIYFVGSQLLMRIETGSFGGIAIALIFTFAYLQGVRGTFFLSKNEAEKVGSKDTD